MRPIRINTGSSDTDGRLVLADDRLVAVFVRLTGEEHGPLRGSWALEAGFGPCQALATGGFETLRQAGEWVRAQLAAESLG